jgi:SAM-dependent methyltransferase
MSEPSWAEGYVVDVGYTHGYYREIAPATLHFVALLAGVQGPEAGQPFTYYELGCGNGHSLTLHAAANPLGRFVGVDFNPLHIRNAQALAREAGVENATFLEKSFAELVAEDLPEADMIALHGVHSWVNDENRRHIVEFIRRRLKPGGLAYVSYNCLPGLGQVAPLQRLLVEHAGAGGGTLADRMHAAIEFANRLDAAGAEFFRVNPLAKLRLAQFAKHDSRYIAHEYFNANWWPSYHADVAKEMAAAKLGFIGSASIVDHFDQFILTPEMAQVVASVGDRTMAETVRDFARNQMFRRDVFARGAPVASGPERERMLGAARFALARPRQGCKLTSPTPSGEVSLKPESYAPVLDALARSPMTFDELARSPETAAFDRRHLRQGVFGMAALGNVVLALPAAGEDARRAATSRFNRAVLSRPVPAGANTLLASPVLGAGVALNLIDRLLLGVPGPGPVAVESVCDAILATGQQLRKDDRLVETRAELETLVATRAAVFFDELLPHLRSLGVVASAGA